MPFIPKVALAAAAMSVLIGCGGGGSQTQEVASVSFVVTWPELKSRFIHDDVDELVFVAKPGASSAVTKRIARPAIARNEEVTFPNLMVGQPIEFEVTGIDTDADPDVTLVAASFTRTFTVGPHTETISLSSVATSLEITPGDSTAEVGATLTLHATALKDSTIILSNPSSFVWSSSAPDVATISSEGLLTALSAGTTVVSVTEKGGPEPSGLTQSVTIQVKAPTAMPGLADSGWPKFRGSALNSGLGEGQGAAGTLAWKYQTGDAIYSSPSIGEDGTIYVGSYDNSLYAINSTTGTKQWSYATDGDIFSSPAVTANGTVYFGSKDSFAYALVGASGSLKWRQSYSEFGEIVASPSVGSDGTVYLAADGMSQMALGGELGDVKWSMLTGAQVYGSAAIATDGSIAFGSYDGKVYCLNSDGSLRWTYTTGAAVESSPAFSGDGTLYVGSYDGKLYALDGSTGAFKWSFHSGGAISSSPAISADGTVVIGSQDQSVYAIGADGTIKWSFATSGRITSSPAVGADGTVYIGSWDSSLYALDGTSGVQKWRFATGAGIRSSPAIGRDGTVYVGSGDGALYAIR